jgi:3-deoxy-D-manno-octulosonate 8-phosphate phosphatase (KDO 8-P phosphatase)
MTKFFSEELKRKAERIDVLVLDVDGVLTDGRIIIDDRGRESKHFNVRDGHGIKLILKTGIEVVFLTGRKSRVVAHRAQDLGIREVYQGARDKVMIFEGMLLKKNMKADRVAYMGDDVVDIPLFRKAGLSIAVADACEEAKQAAHYVTEKEGGKGAVREVCEMILRAQGKWDEIAKRYTFK